jgi:hypothetical protein
MAKIVISVLALVVVASSIYTSSYWTKRGVDVTDGIIPTETNPKAIYL